MHDAPTPLLNRYATAFVAEDLVALRTCPPISLVFILSSSLLRSFPILPTSAIQERGKLTLHRITPAIPLNMHPAPFPGTNYRPIPQIQFLLPPAQFSLLHLPLLLPCLSRFHTPLSLVRAIITFRARAPATTPRFPRLAVLPFPFTAIVADNHLHFPKNVRNASTTPAVRATELNAVDEGVVARCDVGGGVLSDC